MAKQMIIEDRKRIDFLIQLGWTPTQIAKDRGRSKSTIIREIVNRSIVCDRGYRCSNRICALFDCCPRIKGYGKDAKRSFNCTPRCFEVCPDFVERTCDKLSTPSHVCNGCKDFKSCPMMKRLYVADGAQANRESLLHDSRMGVHPDAEAIAKMNEVLSPCIMKGQSVRNVIANNPDAFGTVKERTVYDYIAGGLFYVKRGDLPEACRRRACKKKKETKTNAKCRAGRDYRTFLEFCRINGITQWTELDTVIGRIGGQGFSRQAGDREVPSKRGHAQSDSPWRKVQAPCGQGHSQKGGCDPGEEARIPKVKEPPIKRGKSPPPVSAENSLRMRTAGALYQISAKPNTSRKNSRKNRQSCPESPQKLCYRLSNQATKRPTMTSHCRSRCIYLRNGAFTFARYDSPPFLSFGGKRAAIVTHAKPRISSTANITTTIFKKSNTPTPQLRLQAA